MKSRVSKLSTYTDKIIILAIAKYTANQWSRIHGGNAAAGAPVKFL